MEDIVGDVDDQSLREKLQSCRHFLLDSEIQKGRHSMFTFNVNNLTAQVIEEKLDRVLDKLKCVAKLNLALGFILKNIEDGKFRYFFCSWEQHPVGTVKTCEKQRRHGKIERDFEENWCDWVMRERKVQYEVEVF